MKGEKTTMIAKFDEVYVDMNAVDAASPCREEPGYSLFLRGGRILCLPNVTQEQVEKALRDAGKFWPLEEGVAL